jgi:hypothetical protein
MNLRKTVGPWRLEMDPGGACYGQDDFMAKRRFLIRAASVKS